MLAGAQVTNHSAVVGPPSPSLTVPTFGTFRLASEVPNIQAIGPLRRQSMLAVVDLLRKRLSTLDYTDGRSLANAASRLAVAWMSLTTFTSREIEPERHGALGGCVLRGVYLLGIARPDQVEERKNIVVYTQGLAVCCSPDPLLLHQR